MQGEITLLIYLAMIDSPDDQAKFERVYLQYRYLMLHVAKKILHNHQDAEDAVHQAFISIIKNIEKISAVGSPETRSYIVIITERKAIDILRRNQRHPASALDDEMIGLDIPAPEDHPLAAAMAKLPAHYRQALLLRYDNGFSSREIASLLGISESGVRKLLARGKKALQRQLEDEGVVI